VRVASRPSPPATLPEGLRVAGDDKEKTTATDAEVLGVDSPGQIGTPESMDAAAGEKDAPLDADEISDDLEDAFAGPGSSGNRPGYVAAGGYNALKSFNGQVYSGMAIGGSHTWNYDQGQWKETKVEPDLWKVDFETKKRRARNAPKGSGAPVGTEYHWLVVAHQVSSGRGQKLSSPRGADYLTDLSFLAARQEDRCKHIRDSAGGIKVQARAQAGFVQFVVSPNCQGPARTRGRTARGCQVASPGIAPRGGQPEGEDDQA